MTGLDFVIGGAQKCGTSSLWLWLLRHRELGMIARKEAHFFDDERRDWTSPDYTDLHAMIPQDRRYGGDATPITLYWTPAHARLRAYNPRCRIVLLFRDPVDRAASQWAMRTQKGVEDLPFARAVREGRTRTGEVVEVEGLSRGLSYLERGRYGEQLGRLLELFPRDQVLCLDLAGLARGREADLLRTVTDFLGVEPDGFGSYDPVHLMASTVTPVIDLATRELLAEEFADDLRLFAGPQRARPLGLAHGARCRALSSWERVGVARCCTSRDRSVGAARRAGADRRARRRAPPARGTGALARRSGGPAPLLPGPAPVSGPRCCSSAAPSAHPAARRGGCSARSLPSSPA